MAYSAKGRAFRNEDRYFALHSFPIFGGVDVCGIFDGHNGTDASTFCEKRFPELLVS